MKLTKPALARTAAGFAAYPGVGQTLRGDAVDVQVGPWRIAADPEATRRVHDRLQCGRPERCGCLYCTNFVAVRAQAYPVEAMQLFQTLGIRHDRESEVSAPVPLIESQYLYSGWFHFVGRIVGWSVWQTHTPQNPGQAPTSGTMSELRFHALTDHFGILMRPERSLLPEEFRNQSVVQLDFTTELPWVLSEPPEC